jgi:Protein of unknown function (DUF1353)
MMRPMDEAALSFDQTPVEIAASSLPPPLLTYVGDGRWQLEADYTYQDGETTITVPQGFRFDLSSVPRAFWSVIAPFELSIVAPLLHDFLYRYGGSPPAGTVDAPRTYTRAEADRMFRTIMEIEGVPAWRRTLAYWAVRTFGRGAWHA